MPRFTLKQLLLGIAALAIVITALAWLTRLLNPFDNVAFNQADWASGNTSTRARMAGDLVDNHLAVGMSQAQVETLIGRADEVLSPNAAAAFGIVQGTETHAYNVEIDGNLFVAGCRVCVVYNANGTVVDALISSNY
jgi:hypothetical protein